MFIAPISSLGSWYMFVYETNFLYIFYNNVVAFLIITPINYFTWWMQHHSYFLRCYYLKTKAD
jgi:hypothetical protein